PLLRRPISCDQLVRLRELEQEHADVLFSLGTRSVTASGVVQEVTARIALRDGPVLYVPLTLRVDFDETGITEVHETIDTAAVAPLMERLTRGRTATATSGLSAAPPARS